MTEDGYAHDGIANSPKMSRKTGKAVQSKHLQWEAALEGDWEGYAKREDAARPVGKNGEEHQILGRRFTSVHPCGISTDRISSPRRPIRGTAPNRQPVGSELLGSYPLASIGQAAFRCSG